MGITWELVRNENSQVPIPDLLIGPCGGAQQSMLFKASKRFWYMLKFENHWYRTWPQNCPVERLRGGETGLIIHQLSYLTGWGCSVASLDPLAHWVALCMVWARTPSAFSGSQGQKLQDIGTSGGYLQCTQKLSTTAESELKKLAKGLWGGTAIESAPHTKDSVALYIFANGGAYSVCIHIFIRFMVRA